MFFRHNHQRCLNQLAHQHWSVMCKLVRIHWSCCGCSCACCHYYHTDLCLSLCDLHEEEEDHYGIVRAGDKN